MPLHIEDEIRQKFKDKFNISDDIEIVVTTCFLSLLAARDKDQGIFTDVFVQVMTIMRCLSWLSLVETFQKDWNKNGPDHAIEHMDDFYGKAILIYNRSLDQLRNIAEVVLDV